MPHLRRRSFVRVVILASVLAVPGIAMAQASGSGDLKTIAGKWSGTALSSQGTVSLEWTIRDDGTVAAVTGAPDGQRKSSGRMSVRDGNFFYETGASSGIVTLEEAGGRRVLKYDAIFKRDNSRGSAELIAVR